MHLSFKFKYFELEDAKATAPGVVMQAFRCETANLSMPTFPLAMGCLQWH